MSRYQTYLVTAPQNIGVVVGDVLKRLVVGRSCLTSHLRTSPMTNFKTMPDYGAELRIVDHTAIGKKKTAGRRLAMI